MANEQDLMERIVALAKRRGFIYPSSEIYGGINGFWDYGPLGVELKRNLKDAWWQDIVRCPPAGPDGRPLQMVGLDCSIIMNPKVWEASGHVTGFTDPMVDCKESNNRYRADQLMVIYAWDVEFGSGDDSQARRVFAFVHNDAKSFAAALSRAKKEAKKLGVKVVDEPPVLPLMHPEFEGYWQWVVGPDATEPGTLTQPRQFNLMFKSHAGAMEDSASLVYLRPETAQGIFCNYKNVTDTTRIKVPFGIAQIGKAFRNEINPRNFTFRSREFEQMEIEFFCHPSQADPWYAWWRDARFKWYVDYGLKSSKLRLRDHEKEELAHYARACADVEYEFPFGTSELEGIANRTDFDLAQHQKFSGRDMTYFDDETKERFIPHVIEPSGGIDRAALAFLCEAYCEDEAPDENGAMQRRTVLRFHPRLAPVKAAIFPLVKKDGMPEKALEIYAALRPQMTAFYDEKGAVGRRYRRQDEAGTPFCITVDGQTREDGTVTIRDRDSMKQERIASDAPTLLGCLQDRLRR
jgi:glycyl-tRNA synthetase